MPKRFIVKIQKALSSSISNPPLLIYNQDRSVFEQLQDDSLTMRIMQGENKAFFYAHLDINNKLVVDELAPWQEW